MTEPVQVTQADRDRVAEWNEHAGGPDGDCELPSDECLAVYFAAHRIAAQPPASPVAPADGPCPTCGTNVKLNDQRLRAYAQEVNTLLDRAAAGERIVKAVFDDDPASGGITIPTRRALIKAIDALAPVGTGETAQREQFDALWYLVKGHEDEQPKVPNDWAWEKRCAYWVWLKAGDCECLSKGIEVCPAHKSNTFSQARLNGLVAKWLSENSVDSERHAVELEVALAAPPAGTPDKGEGK